MKQQRKTSVIICIAVLLAAVMGLAVYSSVRLKSPGTEDNNADNKAAVDSATVCALSYDIDLKLDTEKERMEQTVFMDIINKSDDEDFSSLYIRYYPNGYIGALMKENPEIKEENEGRSSAVTSVTWKGSDEQLKITYDQDDTLIKVDLESDPLKAGETRTLQVNAWTDLPVCDYRFGVYKRDEGSLFQLAFCYPYLEYYTDGGWCLDPPEYTFENRNPELADYHVTVEAPESFLVAGPGTVKREGTRTTVDAETLRDLAIYVSDFMDVDTFEVEGVKIENYYLKTTGEEAYRTLSKQFITDAITLLTELVGPYVRDSFVMVEGTSNMEYSGIADVSGADMFTEDLSAYSSVYKYAIHEITHQWFYYAVGNNENRESWIDEGITTFLTNEIMYHDTESYHLLKEYYSEGASPDEYISEQEMIEGIYESDLAQLDHYDLVTQENNKDLITFMGMDDEFALDTPGKTEYAYAPHFLYKVKQLLGEEVFSAFLKDVYTSYRLKIADTKGVLELLTKYNDSEEIRKLIEFYFPGDIVNELFAS